jgi:type I restriction enzyme S subunit
MIANGWVTTALGEVLSHRKGFVRLDDMAEYQRCRVQLGARGIVLRDRVLGFDIKTKDQQVCHAGDVLVAEIDAKLGGFGIVPQELDGAIVSSHYFLYEVNPEKINRAFLGYYLRTQQFQQQVTPRGSTNYSAIRPHHVLSYTIPLPKRAHQDRLAGKLDEIAARLQDARRITSEIDGEATALLGSAFARLTRSAPQIKMTEAAPLLRRPVEVRMGEDYPELGIRSFGKGTFHKPALDFLAVGSKRLYRIEPGDLLFNNVFAWEGAIAVAQPEDAGRFGSHRFITCVPKPGVATADFLRFYFLTREGLEKIGKASPGGAGRNRTLGLEKLADIQVPVPTYEQQLEFDRLQKKVQEMLSVQEEEVRELDAMLPSVLDRAFKGML